MRGSSALVGAVGLTLIAVAGCTCEEGYSELREIEFEPRAELRAVASYDVAPFYLADAAGGVTKLETGRHGLEVVDVIEVGSLPLVDIAAGNHSVHVVDEAGTLHQSFDDGATWTSHPLDSPLEPRGLVMHWFGIIYGDGFVRALDADGEWFEPPIPDGGWGSLRAGTVADGLILSDGESLLFAEGNPERFEWQRIDAPIEVLTLANEGPIIGGANGVVMTPKSWSLGPNTEWTTIQLPTDADIVGLDLVVALTSAGELFELHDLALLGVSEANAGLSWGTDILVFGASGPLMTTSDHACHG